MGKDIRTPEKGPPRKLNLEASQIRATVNTYPRLVTELARVELKMLTEILHLDNMQEAASRYESQIRQMVEALPKRLRKEWYFTMPWTQSRWQPTALCEMHRSLNSALINDILQLVQKEVTVHFRKFDAFPQLVCPVEAHILAGLRALKGMWTKPEAGRSIAPMAWAYQINGCAACMLARVAADKTTVRNLRVMLQSRTRTRKEHRARRLMPFIDECINRFGDYADELHSTASQLAIIVKDTRKACIRAWRIDPTREHRSRRKHKHDKQPSDSSSNKNYGGQNRPGISFAELPRPSSSMLFRQQDNQGASHTADKTTSGQHGRLSTLTRSQSHSTPTNKNGPMDYRSRRSEAPSPESRQLNRQTVPGWPANPEPPSTIPSPISESASTQTPRQAHSQNDWASDLDEQIDDLIASYQTLRVHGKPTPRDRDTKKSSSSTVTRQAAMHTLEAAMSRRRARELAIAAMDGTVDRSEELGWEYRQLVSSGVASGRREFGRKLQLRVVNEDVEVPLVYQYSPSEYSDSEWTDAECEDPEFETLRQKDPSPAVTTWSLVCDEANVI